MRFIPDKFVLLMVAVVALAIMFPWLGGPQSPVDLVELSKLGIAVVFFLHGANLSAQKLVDGVRRWQVHLLIQATTFVVFPLIGVVLWISLQSVLPEELLLGFFFLAALPSTIATSVAMTAMAGGNVSVAVFNATLSGLLGMVVTPILMSFVASFGLGEFSILAAMRDIALTLLAPFVLGQFARPFLKDLLTTHKKLFSIFDRGVILLIIFGSFARSTAEGIWSRFSLTQMSLTLALVIAILGLVFVLTIYASRHLKMSREDEIAALFCGSTKSLANGAPIAQILFAGTPALGFILLPLMLYHQLQIMACGVIAGRYARLAARADNQ